MRSIQISKKLSNLPGLLTALLPVHNRGSLTASFVLHLSELLPDKMNLRVVIFDDGCTDKTITNVKEVWPSAEVVSLDGSAFWGGAINAISDYVKLRPLSEESIYLLANDDIRFPSKSAFLAGLREVNTNALVCALGLHVPSLDNHSFINTAPELPTSYQGTHYNSKTGNFEKASVSKPVNISGTRAMLSTIDAWLLAPVVPKTIPHYLSDYWLTYKLVLQGYEIVHPSDFICLVNAHTSRTGKETTWDKRNWLRIKKDYLKDSLIKSSPSYLPAWIEFLSQKPIYPSARKKILKLKLHKLVASLIYNKVLGG